MLLVEELLVAGLAVRYADRVGSSLLMAENKLRMMMSNDISCVNKLCIPEADILSPISCSTSAERYPFAEDHTGCYHCPIINSVTLQQADMGLRTSVCPGTFHVLSRPVSSHLGESYELCGKGVWCTCSGVIVLGLKPSNVDGD